MKNLFKCFACAIVFTLTLLLIFTSICRGFDLKIEGAGAFLLAFISVVLIGVLTGLFNNDYNI